MKKRTRRFLILFAAFAITWAQLLSHVFEPGFDESLASQELSTRAQAMLERAKADWQDEVRRNEITASMRRGNPEWDLMYRLFLVGALANAALGDPAFESSALETIDSILHDTIAKQTSYGDEHFLLPYGHSGDYAISRPRGNQFVDGEIAWMIAARRLVRDDGIWKSTYRSRIERLKARMRQSHLWSAESYPDENWVFCNTLTLAAMHMGDAVDGTDHSRYAENWLRAAQENLTDEGTGMLISSYHHDGRHRDGPEGSSIWMAIHNMTFFAPEEARRQYSLAQTHLAGELLGFGYSREWPGQVAQHDVDSGATIPVLGASPSASALALVAAAAMNDQAYRNSTLATLEFAGFPGEDEHGLRYLASNPLGDAVVLYALTGNRLARLVNDNRTTAQSKGSAPSGETI